MNLQTIEMDRKEARERFLEYRRAVRDRHNAEDEQIMRGYRELSKGRQIIDITATVRAGGTVKRPWRLNTAMAVLPRLAVMRADQPWCAVSVSRDGRVTYYKDQFGPQGREVRNVVRLPAGSVTLTLDPDSASHFHFRAMVPPVPPSLRPGDSLGNYHVLWEADWEAQPPTDPALLKHVGGDLYVVLAVWDLTELERAVLAGRNG